MLYLAAKLQEKVTKKNLFKDNSEHSEQLKQWDPNEQRLREEKTSILVNRKLSVPFLPGIYLYIPGTSWAPGSVWEKKL